MIRPPCMPVWPWRFTISSSGKSFTQDDRRGAASTVVVRPATVWLMWTPPASFSPAPPGRSDSVRCSGIHSSNSGSLTVACGFVKRSPPPLPVALAAVTCRYVWAVAADWPVAQSGRRLAAILSAALRATQKDSNNIFMTVYLDNAATSFPKPEAVYLACDRALRQIGGNPGRGGHRMALEASRLVFQAREVVAALFGITDTARIVFYR